MAPNPVLPRFLESVARLRHRVNSGTTDTGQRRRINWVDNASITFALTDDPVNEEIAISATALSGAPSGTAGGALDGTYPNPGLAASVAGAGLAETSDVLSVNVDGSTLEINADTLRVKAGGIGPNEIASTTVTAGTYGDTVHVATFTVDADGRQTAAANTKIARHLYAVAAQTFAGTSETDMLVSPVPQGLLGTNDDSLQWVAGGNFSGHATATTRIKAYLFGTAVIDTGALALTTAGAYEITATTVRSASGTVFYVARLTLPAGAITEYVAVSLITGLDLAGTDYQLKVTGQMAGVGAGSNQLSGSISFVTYFPRA